MSKVKTKGTTGRIKYWNDGYSSAFPIVLMLAALVIYPMAYGSYVSLFNTNLMAKWKFVGFKYYIGAFTDPSFYKSVLLTFEFMILVIIGHFILGFILATLLNREFGGRAVFRAIFMLSRLFPEAVITLLFTWVVSPVYGVLNNMLKSLGTISTNISWLGSKELAFPSVVFTCIWKGFLLVMAMILAELQSVSEDLYKAAVIDGANKWNSLRYITLPSLKPILTTVIIPDSVWWFEQYIQIFAMTADGPDTVMNLISLSVYGTVFSDLGFGKGAAWGILVFVIYYPISSVYRVVPKGE